MRYTLTALLATAGTGLALLAGAGAANAAPTQATVQQQIDGILAKNPDAVQTGKSTVTLDKGAVTLRLAGATGVDACGAGLFCLWEHADYGGQMVSWKGSPVLCKANRTINLTDYGFSDRASSWANNSDYLVDVWEHEDRGGRRLWTELPGTYLRENPDGDEATSLNCYA